MTDNRAYKQRVRDLMERSPIEMGYSTAKKIIDEQQLHEQSGAKALGPIKRWLDNAAELPAALELLDEHGMDFFAPMDAHDEIFLHDLSWSERAKRDHSVVASSAEALMMDVPDDEPHGYARAIVRLVSEFGLEELRRIMARVFVYVYSEEKISDEDAVVSDKHSDLINGLLEIYATLSDAHILQLTTWTLRAPAWNPVSEEWDGFGSSSAGSITLDGYMDFETSASPTFTLDMAKIPEMVEKMRERKNLDHDAANIALRKMTTTS